MEDNNLDIIKNTLDSLLRIIGFEAVVDVRYSHSEECILANIQVDQSNSGFLIGQGGNNLDSMQYISRLLVNKNNNQPIKFILDVNNYRKHKVDLLRITAKDIAKQVIIEKTSLALKPMSAYERRIIHMALSDNPLISTESIGDDPERRVVVKLCSGI